MSDVAVLVILFLVLLAALFLIPRLMMGRAVRSIIRAFRQNLALNEKNAKTLDELGIGPANRRWFGLRDYKPAALQALVNANIIRTAEDGRFYLSEESLASTGLERR
ncbi:MAG: hypothetical protein IBX68_09945 [Dehalococcoidia bacterium]|nr:hypothetical protein [Dehalococcoidia bacterium]